MEGRQRLPAEAVFIAKLEQAACFLQAGVPGAS
jgi:hypothetical protein